MKTLQLLICTVFFFIQSVNAQTNPWYTGAQQTLPEHVPMPLDQLFQAGQMLQKQREAEAQKLLIKEAENIQSHRELHLATKYFKQADDGRHNVTTIIQGKRITKATVVVYKNRIKRFIIGDEEYDVPSPLKVTSEIINAYNKVFVEYNFDLVPVEFYFTDLYSNVPIANKRSYTDNNLLYTLGENSKIPVYELPSSTSPVGYITKNNQNKVVILVKNINTGYSKVRFDTNKVGYILNTRIQQ